jgi:hypothetical protein
MQVMFIRFVAVALLTLSLLATAGSAQTAAELLQKGIYAQETAGDLDAALQIYRQVVGSAGNQRALAAQAQMRIVGILLQKGDNAGATLEFNILVQNYADQKEIIASIAARLGAVLRSTTFLPTAPPKLTKGTLENGLYHHTLTGTEIRVPAGWSIIGDGGSSGGGEAVGLADNSGLSYFVWMISDAANSAAEIPAVLDRDVEYKLHQRTADGLPNFKMRGTAFKFRSGNRQGVTVAFEFGSADKLQIEYDTYVRTEKTMVYFRTICPAASFSMAQDSRQFILEATVLP